MSLANGFAVALAKEKKAELFTGGLEFRVLEKRLEFVGEGEKWNF